MFMYPFVPVIFFLLILCFHLTQSEGKIYIYKSALGEKLFNTSCPRAWLPLSSHSFQTSLEGGALDTKALTPTPKSSMRQIFLSQILDV